MLDLGAKKTRVLAKQQIANSGLKSGKTNIVGGYSEIQDPLLRFLSLQLLLSQGSLAEQCYTVMSLSLDT